MGYKDTDQNISATSLTYSRPILVKFVDLCSGLSSVVDHKPKVI